jgi:hypothetical protein
VLKPGLLEGKDVVLVPERQHSLLAQWYGVYPHIRRKVVLARCGRIVELYPLQLWVEIEGKSSSRKPLFISRTTPISDVYTQAVQLVEPATSSELRLVVPGPGTPGGDVLSKSSHEAVEMLCDAHEQFAVLSFREVAADAPIRGLVRSSESTHMRSDFGQYNPYSSDSVFGPNSLPCSPPGVCLCV